MPVLIHFKGNRSPSVTDTIKVDNEAFDLTGSSVKFKMRLESSDTLKVNTAATVVSAAAGTVQYDWLAADVDTVGEYVGWWEVTLSSGKTQDTLEFPIRIVEHAPGDTDYITPEHLKATLQLDGTSYADSDVQRAISAASRGIDWECGRRFYADADANQARYYSPISAVTIEVDDIITLTTLETDQDGDGTFEQAWTVNTDFVLEPLNAAADGWPYTRITIQPLASQGFPSGFPRSVKVTAKFGWSDVPDQVVQACGLVASKLLKRAREDPGGSAEAIALGGAAVRLVGSDPTVKGLLAPYIRHRPGYF